MRKNVLHTALILVAGLSLGALSKLLDLYTTNLGNIFSELSIWILFGKTVLPFYTHGGGGAGRSMGDVKKACPGALVTVGVDANGATDKRLGDWLSQVGLQEKGWAFPPPGRE